MLCVSFSIKVNKHCNAVSNLYFIRKFNKQYQSFKFEFFILFKYFLIS